MPLNYVDAQEQYEKNKDLKKADIEVLQEWLRKLPHFPAAFELELIFALHSCFYSIERTKATLENYFTMRTACPEFFGKIDPVKFQNTLDVMAIIPLPKLTQDGYQTVYCNFINSDPNAFIFSICVKYMEAIIKIRLFEHGTVEGIVAIVDMKEMSFGHLTKLSLMELRKFISYLQEALIVRLKGIHIINTPSFIETLMAMIKPYMNVELLNLIYFHSDKLETLYKYVPQELLPKDFGGSTDSVANLHDYVKKTIISNADYIESEEMRLVDESKRPGKPIDVDALFGIDGSFKRLDID